MRYQLIAAIVIIAAILIASSMDAEDAAKEQSVYCEMVRDGHWPDYNNNASEVCK